MSSENGGTRTAIYAVLVLIVALAVIGVVFSPENTINILGFCGVICGSLFAHLSTIRTAEKVEQKVAEVKTALTGQDGDTKTALNGIAKMGERNHVLLNSGLLSQLKISMLALRRISDLTKHPDDIAAAEAAATAYHEHEANQKKLDAIDAKDDVPPEVKVTNLPPVQEVRVVE